MSAVDHDRLGLVRGSLLNDYRVLDVLGTGGFGVTYLVEELPHGRCAAIKEYLPSEFAVRSGSKVLPRSSAVGEDFEWGLMRFVDEAKTLAHFEHAHVVRVEDWFRANNTAYIVMEYEDGKPLSVLLERHRVLTEGQLKRLLFPLLDGLREVHRQHFLHRDIKPANIYVRRSDGSPVLLDFGAARQALGRRSRQMTAFVTPGYSPLEQHQTGSEGQGRWSDIYALAAVCYRAITGEVPAVATHRSRQSERGADPVARLVDEAWKYPAYSTAMLHAVDCGLRLAEAERPQSVDEWLRMIEQPAESNGRTKEVHSQALERPSRAPSVGSQRRLLIGRGRDAHVTLEDASVSRRHAELVVPQACASGYVVKDCGSSNGTFVWRGGRWERVREEVVEAREPLRFGNYETSAATLAAMAME